MKRRPGLTSMCVGLAMVLLGFGSCAAGSRVQNLYYLYWAVAGLGLIVVGFIVMLVGALNSDRDER